MSKPQRYSLSRYATWDDVPVYWHDRARIATPFQTPAFLSSWYASLGQQPSVTPLIFEALETGTGRPAALWPLVLEQRGGLRTIGFADGGLMDNCAPLTGEAFPYDAGGFQDLWRSVICDLPGADLLHVDKAPATLKGRPNPFVALPWIRPSAVFRLVLRLPEDFKAYSFSRKTKFRKEQERVWRVFTRHEGAQFENVTDLSRARALFGPFQDYQKQRMAGLNVNYKLDQPVYRQFADKLLEAGLASGAVRLCVLTAQDELVGGLLVLSNGETESFVRICHAPGKWATCSPGRLVLERTLMELHAAGARETDFSIGDFDYKYGFGVQSEPLWALTVPLSWRGQPAWLGTQLRAELKKSPLVQRLRRALRNGSKSMAQDDAA